MQARNDVAPSDDSNYCHELDPALLSTIVSEIIEGAAPPTPEEPRCVFLEVI